MDFFEVVRKRRSVRKYTAKPVPQEVIKKAIEAALLAPNSSNLQPWEFYWVRDPQRKSELVEACLSQGAAKTAQELIVAVSRIDTWKKHVELLYANAQKTSKDGVLNPLMVQYYKKLIPMMYTQDPFGVLGFIRKIAFTLIGFFRPIMRGPAFPSELYETVTKTTALACENFMLAITAQGYATCPMEGFDECRVRRAIGLRGRAHVVMVISVGEADAKGIFGEQFRVDPSLVVYEV